MGGKHVLKSEKRETQSYKKRYGPRRHKILGINKWVRKNREIKKQNPEAPPEKWIKIVLPAAHTQAAGKKL